MSEKDLPPIQANLFGISEDHIEKYQSLDVRFIRNRSATFFFEMDGDSMDPLVASGDILVVDRSVQHFEKRVVVFGYRGEMHCRRWVRHGDRVLLKSHSRPSMDIILQHESEIQMFGVVVAAVRDLL